MVLAVEILSPLAGVVPIPNMVSKMPLFTEFFSPIFITLRRAVLDNQGSQSYLTHTKEIEVGVGLVREIDVNTVLYVSIIDLIS